MTRLEHWSGETCKGGEVTHLPSIEQASGDKTEKVDCLDCGMYLGRVDARGNLS